MPSILPGEPPGDSGTAGRAQRELFWLTRLGAATDSQFRSVAPGAMALPWFATLITVCQRRLLIGKLETRFLCLPDSKVLLSENDDPLKQATPIRGSRNWKLDIESVVSTSIRKQVMQE